MVPRTLLIPSHLTYRILASFGERVEPLLDLTPTVDLEGRGRSEPALPGAMSDETSLPQDAPELDELPPRDDDYDEEALAHEVAFVVPAAAYEAIDTVDDRTDSPEEVVPPTESIDDRLLPAIEALGQAMLEKIEGLQTQFEREIRAEATREKVIDRLHAELQEYKQGLHVSLLKPVFIDLIQLHDDIGKMTEASTEEDREGPAGRYLSLLSGVQQGIEDILYRQGVEPFVDAGESFDPKRQRALTTVATDEPDRNKQIAGRLRKGFQSEGRVIRPELVSVYSYKIK